MISSMVESLREMEQILYEITEMLSEFDLVGVGESEELGGR